MKGLLLSIIILNSSNTSDEETRRYFASNLLKEYIDINLPNDNVIVLGDLNDNISDDSQNNVFQGILDDDDNYLFADFDIANGNNSNWSFPTWPSHLDHILITNELIDEFENENSDIQTIRVDEYLTGGWAEYDQNISDHRPVALKLVIGETLNAPKFDHPKTVFLNNPNPFNSETIFSFNTTIDSGKIEIYNLNGKKIVSLNLLKGKSTISLNAEQFSNGIYIAKLISQNNIIATRKLVIIK